MLVAILLTAVAAFSLAYTLYGRFLANRYELDDGRATPSHTDYDGIDRVPAHKAVLLLAVVLIFEAGRTVRKVLVA